jgi:RHS repeat-associated protein
LDRVEIQLSADDNIPEKGKKYSGHLMVLNTLRMLPVGSTLDGERGVFYWQPGPAFYGQYEFVFIREGEERSRQNIKIRIGKADSQWDEDFKIPSPEYGREPLVEGSDSAVQDTKSISSYQEGIASSRTSPKGSIIPLGSSGVTYYIHSYDGKVLAEYDQNGNCVRDYIYVVDLLRAEYRPLEAKYYYYTSDQVNSVRVVTKDAGNAVYVAAYSPYGKIQEEWVPTYQPSLKFSGKERETGSEVDYFGARYYNHKHYRFLSVDPVINRDEALSNPQLWNLYAYCRNNPITYWDPDGRSFLKFDRSEQKITLYDNAGKEIGTWDASNYAEKGTEKFPIGTWKYHHYTPHPEAKEEDPISGSGFYGFDVKGNKTLGVHAGRKGQTDQAGRTEWKYATKGCIRTIEDAMKAIAERFQQQDPLTKIVVQE